MQELPRASKTLRGLYEYLYWELLACELNLIVPGRRKLYPDVRGRIISRVDRNRKIGLTFYSVAEAASKLQLHEQSVKKYIYTGAPVRNDFWLIEGTTISKSFHPVPLRAGQPGAPSGAARVVGRLKGGRPAPKARVVRPWPILLFTHEGILIGNFVSATAAAEWLTISPHTVLSYLDSGELMYCTVSTMKRYNNSKLNKYKIPNLNN